MYDFLRKLFNSLFISRSKKSPARRAAKAAARARLRRAFGIFEPLEPRLALASHIVDDGDPGYSTQLFEVEIDYGLPGYSESGNWLTSGIGGENGGSRYGGHHSNLTSSKAVYDFTLLTGTSYELFVNTPGHWNSTSAAKYSIDNGQGSPSVVTLDQRDGTNGWLSLGVYSTPLEKLKVTLTSSSGGYLRADAMKVVPTNHAFRSSTISAAHEHDGDSDYAYQGTAKFQFDDLTPGVNKFEVYIPYHLNSAPQALYTIYDGEMEIDSFTVNQKDIGGSWHTLGNYTLSGTTARVEVSNYGTTGALRADAMRITSPEPYGYSISDVEVDEGGIAHFILSIDRIAEEELTFYYSTASGSAEADLDFEDRVDSAVIPIGQSYVQVAIQTLSDELTEDDETFTVAINTTSTPGKTVPIKSSGTGTIVNINVAPRFINETVQDASYEKEDSPKYISADAKSGLVVYETKVANENQEVQYEITGVKVNGNDNAEGLFSVDDKGKITLAKDINQAEHGLYSVKVRVKDKNASFLSDDTTVWFGIKDSVGIKGDNMASEGGHDNIDLVFVRYHYGDVANTKAITVYFEILLTSPEQAKVGIISQADFDATDWSKLTSADVPDRKSEPPVELVV